MIEFHEHLRDKYLHNAFRFESHRKFWLRKYIEQCEVLEEKYHVSFLSVVK